jgi:hypothetical protein
MKLTTGAERGPNALSPMSAYERTRGSEMTTRARNLALRARGQRSPGERTVEGATYV